MLHLHLGSHARHCVYSMFGLPFGTCVSICSLPTGMLLTTDSCLMISPSASAPAVSGKTLREYLDDCAQGAMQTSSYS